MGRELKRVPLDFDWPMNKLWPGFLNDKHRPCPKKDRTCFNGYTSAGAWLKALVNLIMVAGGDAARGEVHPWLANIPFNPGMPPSPEFVEFTKGLAGRGPSGFGHDAGDKHTAKKKLMAAAGLPKGWGLCPACEGHCVDPAVRAEYEAWKETPPPEGPGFQLWDTTSEGSPISPVFKTLRELAEWAADNATTFGSNKATADEWEKMLAEDNVHHQEGNLIFL